MGSLFHQSSPSYRSRRARDGFVRRDHTQNVPGEEWIRQRCGEARIQFTKGWVLVSCTSPRSIASAELVIGRYGSINTNLLNENIATFHQAWTFLLEEVIATFHDGWRMHVSQHRLLS